jgi:cytochrome c oxidase subunit 1
MTEPSLPIPPSEDAKQGWGTTFLRRLGSTEVGEVARLFRGGTLLLFLVGATLGVVLRTEHLAPTPTLLMPEPFYRVLALHGLVLVFWVLLPGVMAGLGIARLTTLLGVTNLEWPRLMRASFHAWLVGTVFLAAALLLGGPDSGTMLRPPLSTEGGWASPLVALGVTCVMASLTALAACILRSIQRHAPVAKPWSDWPLWVTSLQCSSLLIALVAPILGFTLLLLVFARPTGVGVPPGLWGITQDYYPHLYWFAARPAAVAALLPCVGVLGEVLPAYTGRDLAYRRPLTMALGVASVLSLTGWGEHLLTSQPSVLASAVFSAGVMLLGLPLGVIAVALAKSLRLTPLGWKAPLWYGTAAVGFFAVGTLSGVVAAPLSVHVHLQGTAFMLAQGHCWGLGVGVSAWFAGLVHGLPGPLERRLDSRRLRAGALLFFVGSNLAILPGFVQGARGLVRGSYEYAEEFRTLEVLATVGAWILAVGLVLTYAGLISARRRA